MPNRNYEVCPPSSEIMSCAHMSDFYLFDSKGEVKPMHPTSFLKLLGKQIKMQLEAYSKVRTMIQTQQPCRLVRCQQYFSVIEKQYLFNHKETYFADGSSVSNIF